jgi:hypothetical protein
MYKLILLMWNEEQLHTEWLQGVICPIYKKGERTICSNYRPIMLLNIAYKIFKIILNNRLSEIVESKLSDVQSGFRPNRSTLDNMFFFNFCLSVHVGNYTNIVPTKCTSFLLLKAQNITICTF